MPDTWQECLAQEHVGERIPVAVLPGKESVYRQGRSLVVQPPHGGYAVLSSANYNGGLILGPSAVVNTTGIGGKAEMDLMKAGREVHRQYAAECIRKIGLDPFRDVGLGTAVTMDKAAIVSESFGDLSVSAVVTAGVEGNGGRAGDPASFDEAKKYYSEHGTIVIILIVNADLPDHALARCIVTATEAKTCALQELMASSRYSTGIATGSGTDQIAVLCDRSSALHLENAGKHSKLGELVGRCVLKAVKDALKNWAGMTPESRRSCLSRLDRYKMLPFIRQEAQRLGISEESLESESSRPQSVAAIAAVLHIQDEITWGICDAEAGRSLAINILKSAFPGQDPDASCNLPLCAAKLLLSSAGRP